MDADPNTVLNTNLHANFAGLQYIILKNNNITLDAFTIIIIIIIIVGGNSME